MPVTINGTTGIAGVDGSAGTPAVQGTDTNTGIFFPAADTIAFGEGGAEVARFDSSGNLGIGTSSPAAELDVVRSLDGSTVEILVANTFYAASSTDESVAFQGEFYQNDVAARRGAGYIQFTKAGDFSNNANASANMIFGTRNAGTLAERARITAAGLFQFNSGYGSVATAFGCRAWVNFNGTGVVAIRASGNVTSITDDGTGTYTVNFTDAMPDTNYAAAVSTMETGSTGLTDWTGAIRRSTNASDSMATTFIKVAAFSAGAAAVDPGVVVVTIFR